MNKQVPSDKLTVRAADDRGKVDHGWLKSSHSFSFGSYHDPGYMGFENLRVINDDEVGASGGFPPHPHQNAEIFSYVLEGALRHQDTMGNGSIVEAGGIQYMSAGSGVTHTEFNPSSDERVRFLQIWLQPNVQNEAPRYETLDVDPAEKEGRFRLILSQDGRDDSIQMKSDASVYAATLSTGQSVQFEVGENCKAWVQVARGHLTVNGVELHHGDGLAVNQQGSLQFGDADNAEIILFELGMSGDVH